MDRYQDQQDQRALVALVDDYESLFHIYQLEIKCIEI